MEANLLFVHFSDGDAEIASRNLHELMMLSPQQLALEFLIKQSFDPAHN